MKPTWILIANAANARLLQQEEGTPMVVLKAFHHPESRQKGIDLAADAAGRESTDRSYGAAAYAARQDVRRKEHAQFAHELGEYLEQAALGHEYAALQVFASSPFLGELKQALGDNTHRLLAGTHDLDLTPVGLAELERRVQHELAQSH